MEKANTFFCSGVGSVVGNNHVLFLDVDGIDEKGIIDKTVEMIQTHYLSDCYVIKSSEGNYHVMCLDLLGYKELLPILKEHAHDKWVECRSRGNDFVLRLSPKDCKPSPVLVAIVKSPYNEKKMSNAHRILLNKNFDTRIRKNGRFDDNTKLRFHAYRTRMVKEKEKGMIGYGR